jgi:AcrR family transcriptional regulator
MAAAAHAFAERGYHAVSMRELARTLGRAPATFYSHFTSKEELLYSMQLDAFDTLVATSQRAVEGIRDPIERMQTFVLHHVQYVAANVDVMRVLIREASALAPEQRDVIRQRKEQYFRIAQEIVRGVAQDRIDDNAEIDRVTYCLFGMLNWTYAWYEPAEHGAPERLAETIQRTVLHGIQGAGNEGEGQFRASFAATSGSESGAVAPRPDHPSKSPSPRVHTVPAGTAKHRGESSS